MTKRILPPEGRGYELGRHRKGYFSVVVPEDSTWNFIKNAGFGAGTVPYDTLSGAATDAWEGYTSVDSVLANPSIALSIEASGAIKVTPNGADDAGLYYEITDLPIDTYTFSAYYCGSAGSIFEVYWTDNAGNILSERKTQRGSGVNNYARLHVTFANPSVQTVRLYLIEKSNGEGTLPLFHTSFWMCEDTPYVTLPFDGFSREKFNISGKQQDLPYLWEGLPYFSRSHRSWHAFASGKEVPLQDMGFHLESVVGLGVNAIENNIANISSGGGIYNGTRSGQRIFTLIGTIYGKDLQAVLDYRRQIYETIRPRGRNVYGQPTTLLFRIYDESAETWVGQPLHIYCRYQSGLEGSVQSETSEKVSLTFISEDPYVYSSYRKGYDLTNTAEFAEFAQGQAVIAHRDTDGDWEQINLQTAAGDFCPYVFARGADEILYIGGAFGAVNGVANTTCLLKYNTITGAVTACGTGITGTNVSTILLLPNGKLIVGGLFTDAGGVANTISIAMYDPVANTFASMDGGVASGDVRNMELASDNTVYICGSFLDAGGVAAADYLAVYDLDAGTFAACGVPDNHIEDLAIINPVEYPVAQSIQVYCVGSFPSMAGVSDTDSIAMWDGTDWNSVAGGFVENDVTEGRSVAYNPSNGTLYIATRYHEVPVGARYRARIYSYNGIEFKNLELTQEPLDSGPVTSYAEHLAISEGYLCLASAHSSASSGYFDVILKLKNAVTMTEEVSAKTALTALPVYLYEDNNELWLAIVSTVPETATLIYPVAMSIENNGEICFPYIRYTGECILNIIKNKSAIKTIMYDGYELIDREIVHLNLDAIGTELPTLFSSVHTNITSHILDWSDINFYLLPGTNKMYSSTSGRGTHASHSMCFRERYASIDKAIEYVGG